MLNKSLLSIFILMLSASALFAQETSDQDYINKLNYRRNKLEITVKKRTVNEQRSYSSTDITTTTYSYESFSQTYGNIATSGLSQAEAKEITDWYIYKGEVRELSDLDFLQLVGANSEYARISDIEGKKAGMRFIGNAAIGLGILGMVGGAALSASQSIVTGSALLTVTGFFISAFNLAPRHYIQPDYAQEKIDEYNVALKKKLNLPLTFE